MYGECTNQSVQQPGGLVQTLAASDFILTDNGVPQSITLDESERQPLSILILMQTGASASRQFFDYAKVGTMLSYLTANRSHEIAMVTFDSQPEEQWDFAPNIADLEDGFAHPKSGDSKAAILDAVAYGIGLMRDQPKNRRRVIILLSQTHDDGSRAHAREMKSPFLREMSANRGRGCIYDFVYYEN